MTKLLPISQTFGTNKDKLPKQKNSVGFDEPREPLDIVNFKGAISDLAAREKEGAESDPNAKRHLKGHGIAKKEKDEKQNARLDKIEASGKPVPKSPPNKNSGRKPGNSLAQRRAISNVGAPRGKDGKLLPPNKIIELPELPNRPTPNDPIKFRENAMDTELEKQILELIDEGFSDTEIAHMIEASGVNKDEKGMIGDVKTNGGSLPKDTRKKVKDALNKAKTIGLKAEELESYINDLINEGFSDSEIVNLVEVRAGKVKLTPGKKLTPKEYKQMKADALAKKKAKDIAKAAPPKEEPAVQSSGLDLITQHPDSKAIRSALSNVPAVHKQAAVSWLMKAIEDHKDNHIGAFVRNPHETMQSILKNNNKNKNKVSLPKLKFMGDE